MGLGKGGSSPWILRKDGFGQLRLYLCDFASSRRRQRAAENHPTVITSTEDSGLGTFPFQKLPPEVQLKILEQCSTGVLQSLRLVCRSINRLIARNWSRLPPRRISTVAVLQDFLMSDNDFLYKKCISREFSSFYGATISMLYFDQVEVTWAIFQQLSRALKRSRISVVVLAASNCTFTCSANDFADFLKSHCIDRMVIEMRREDDFSMKLWRDLKYEHVQSLSCFVLHAGAGNTWFFERIRRGMFSFRDFRRVLFDFMDGKLNIEFIRVQGRIEWANSDTARRALSLRDPLFESFMLENPSGQQVHWGPPEIYCNDGVLKHQAYHISRTTFKFLIAFKFVLNNKRKYKKALEE
nr:Cyclin F-box domain containing protein [Haemonchus contortus]